jgi:hypothetical protein
MYAAFFLNKKASCVLFQPNTCVSVQTVVVLCRRVGGCVECAERDQGRVPEARTGADGGVWTGYVRLGLLDAQERQQLLEPGVDDQERIHLVETLKADDLLLVIQFDVRALE